MQIQTFFMITCEIFLHTVRCQCLCCGSRQRATLYHSQPPVGCCPCFSHAAIMFSLPTMDRSPSAGVSARPGFWELTAAWDTKRSPTRHANTKSPHKHPGPKRHSLSEQSRTRFHSFGSNIMNMNNPLASTSAGCTILCSIQAFKMSTQRQKDKLRNKSNNTVWANNGFRHQWSKTKLKELVLDTSQCTSLRYTSVLCKATWFSWSVMSLNECKAKCEKQCS